jgi:hypothetical protein
LGDRLLPLDQLHSWIADRCSQEFRGTEKGKLEYMGPDLWPARVGTCEGSVLDRLRLLSISLADSFGWDYDQASTFVMTGLTPTTPAVRTKTVGGNPISSTKRIILDIDPLVEPRELNRRYKKALADANVRVKVTKKQRRLAVFVCDSPDNEWATLMSDWNEKFPRDAYDDVSRFQRETVAARRMLLEPR